MFEVAQVNHLKMKIFFSCIYLEKKSLHDLPKDVETPIAQCTIELSSRIMQ